MQKRLIVLVGCFSGIVLFPTLGFAESAEQNLDAVVETGGFGIRPSGSPLLTFDLGKWGENTEGYVNPTVVIDSISAPDQKSSTFLPNPYDGSNPVIDPEPWFDEKDYMIRIYNYESAASDFKVTLSRTAFTNTATGKEIAGEYLYFGDFHDSIDFKGGNRTKTLGEANKYWLAESAEISAGASTLIADYRGDAALGEHWLSPFNVPGTDANGYRPFDDSVSMPGEEKKSYKESNISLAINNDTVIPSDGSYTTTLVWTIEKTPN
ncbi:hypothetical protein [Enterococcus larvae]|uniref:hypothetical protein n=1 Tax=Enterococcus larvae TaxID=2794352 RepID=UPI003F2D6E57